MIYNQSTGKLTDAYGNLIGVGYSGNGLGKNNPKMENMKSIGPIPKGKYFIGEPYNSKNTGPFTMALSPYEDNKMYDRSGFAIHGDNRINPGTASHGCIILSRKIRELINKGKDKIIVVI
jgi:lipoprotein-anchoring transpeptidase ErfK/SrfK